MLAKYFPWIDEEGKVKKGLETKTLINLDRAAFCVPQEPTAAQRKEYEKQDWSLKLEKDGKYWIMGAQSKHGFPTPVDLEFVKGIIELAYIHGGREIFEDREIRFNHQELFIYLGKDGRGQTYENYKRAIRRLQATSYRTNIFVGEGKGRGKDRERGFSLISDFDIEIQNKVGPKASCSDPYPKNHWIVLSKTIFQQFEANLITNVDSSLLRRMSPSEQIFYRLVNVRLYQRNNFRNSYDVEELATLLNIKDRRLDKLVERRLKPLVRKMISLGVLKELPDLGFFKKVSGPGFLLDLELASSTLELSDNLGLRAENALDTLLQNYPDQKIPQAVIDSLVAKGATPEAFFQASEAFLRRLETGFRPNSPSAYYRRLVTMALNGKLNTNQTGLP